MERRRCANVTRQLQILAKKIDKVENAENARNGIDKFAEKLERDLLTDFDNAYRSADLAAMKDSADILTDFNGGGSVIQMFVNQHDYFIVQEKLVNTDTLQSEELWIKLSDPDGDSKELEDIMQTLIDEIEQVIVTEMEIIKKVFRNSVAILKVFLQRVFAQRIQQQVEACLMIAEEKSTLAYMRSLHICYSKVGALTKSLKDVFATQSIDNEGELTALLDQNFADIFVPYIESGRYFEAEVKNLNQIITFVLGKFAEMHSHKLSRDHSILSRFTSSSEHNKETSREGQTNSSSASISEKGQGRIGQLMRAVRLERSNSHHKLADDDESEEYEPDISLEQIQKILSYAAESIKRDLELADSKEIPNDAKAFLHLLLDGLGRDVAEMLLDESITNSSNQEAKTVDLGFLKVIRQVSGFIFLISSMIHTVIAPMLSNNTVLKGHTINSLNAFLKRCETKMNNIIQSAIDLSLARITYFLNKQKKKDYAFKSGSEESVSTTQTCIEVCHFLGHIHAVATISLDGRNLELFLHEVGTSFKGLLLDHYKKFNVSAPGALVLSKDVQEYQMEIDKWNISELSEEFGVLHSVANLFTAQYVLLWMCLSLDKMLTFFSFLFFRPDAIQSLIRGSNLSQVKPYILKEYLQRRVDYFTAGVNVFVSQQEYFVSTHITNFPGFT